MLNNLEFCEQDRQHGSQMANCELLAYIHQQPIEFTIAGFYMINKSFLSTVRIILIRMTQIFMHIIMIHFKIIAGIVTYELIVIQFSEN